MTGATSALPSARAIRSASALTRALCLPRAICGPFCSVPPIGTMMVVVPVLMTARSSVHVSSSRNTVSGGWARAGVTRTAMSDRTAAHTRREVTGRRQPPGPASAQPHRAESGDPLLGRGMRGEEPREALPRQRIDDEEVRGGRAGRQRLGARGDLDLLERPGEAGRAAREPCAALVRLELTRAGDRQLDEEGRDGGQDREEDQHERVAAALAVLLARATEERGEVRHARDAGDGAR